MSLRAGHFPGSRSPEAHQPLLARLANRPGGLFPMVGLTRQHLEANRAGTFAMGRRFRYL
jgi:hypothetical protein